MPSIGWQELIVILVVVLVIFGPKRLPEVGRSLGKGIREFKKSTTEIQEQLTKVEPAPPVEEASGPAPQAAPAPVVQAAPAPAAEAPAAQTAEAPGSEPKAS